MVRTTAPTVTIAETSRARGKLVRFQASEKFSNRCGWPFEAGAAKLVRCLECGDTVRYSGMSTVNARTAARAVSGQFTRR